MAVYSQGSYYHAAVAIVYTACYNISIYVYRKDSQIRIRAKTVSRNQQAMTMFKGKNGRLRPLTRACAI